MFSERFRDRHLRSSQLVLPSSVANPVAKIRSRCPLPFHRGKHRSPASGGYTAIEAVRDVANYSDDVPVPAFGPRMVCTMCGGIGADARPNWRECAPVCLFGAPEPRASDGGFQGAAGEPSNLMGKLKRLAA